MRQGRCGQEVICKLLYYGEDYRKLEQELEAAKAAIKKVCRDFDKVNDELARLKRENEELKKNQATKEVC